MYYLANNFEKIHSYEFQNVQINHFLNHQDHQRHQIDFSLTLQEYILSSQGELHSQSQ